MPLNTYITLVAVVIALAAVTVGALLFFTQTLAAGPSGTVAAASILALLATIVLLRLKKP